MMFKTEKWISKTISEKAVIDDKSALGATLSYSTDRIKLEVEYLDPSLVRDYDEYAQQFLSDFLERANRELYNSEMLTLDPKEIFPFIVDLPDELLEK